MQPSPSPRSGPGARRGEEGHKPAGDSLHILLNQEDIPESPGTVIDTFFKQENTVIEITKKVSSKLDNLISKQQQLRAELAITRNNQHELQKQVNDMQKQLLYKLYEPLPNTLSASKAVSVWDIETRTFMQANEEFYSMFGLSEAQVVDMTFDKLFPTFFQPFVYDFFNEMRSNLLKKHSYEPITQKAYISHSNGEEVYVLMKVKPNLPTPGPTEHHTTFNMTFRRIIGL
eukprot:TRINITY_DN23291_c0_g1_i1.p1 TRINITY_DN23291_c0_g1~~TRINITY_DN23291_c0_g1_i1.p1  ORF type:complete len:230 (-),score=46.53 TRINITY_DN23291_c0_g1_i1:128-817(-)